MSVGIMGVMELDVVAKNLSATLTYPEEPGLDLDQNNEPCEGLSSAHG
jgi:hypothetical protein